MECIFASKAHTNGLSLKYTGFCFFEKQVFICSFKLEIRKPGKPAFPLAMPDCSSILLHNFISRKLNMRNTRSQMVLDFALHVHSKSGVSNSYQFRDLVMSESATEGFRFFYI